MAKFFTLLVGIGFESRMIELADRASKDESGQGAYLSGLFQALREDKKLELQVQFNDEKEFSISTTSLIAANSAPVSTVLAQGDGLPDSNDGKLDVTWLDASAKQQNQLRNLLDLLLAEVNEPDNPAIQHKHCTQLHVKADQDFSYCIDGELRNAKALDIKIQANALHIVSNQAIN